jgi:hypothetical protein
MKKIILMIAALTAGLTMAAQQKGEMSVTGTLLLSGGSTKVEMSASGSTKTSKSTNPFAFNLGAGFGYFIMDNVEVSLGLYYGLDREKNGHSTQDTNFYDSESSFTIKPEVAYYIPLGSDTFFWKPAFEMGFKSSSSKSQMNKSDITKEKLPFSFTMGLDILAFEFKPWKHLAFDFSFGGFYYNTITAKESTEVASIKTRVNSVSFGFDNVFSPTLGVKYIF